MALKQPGLVSVFKLIVIFIKWLVTLTFKWQYLSQAFLMPLLNKKRSCFIWSRSRSKGILGGHWVMERDYLMPVILNKDVNFPEILYVGLNQEKIWRKCRPLINLDVERPISLLHVQKDKRDNGGSLQFTDIRCGVWVKI